MVIRMHSQLTSPILNPYRELAPFGLTTESSQREVLKIDMQASFKLPNKDVLTWIREPDRRIQLDFFCLPFRDVGEVPDDFDATEDLEGFAASWYDQVLKHPDDRCTLHRLGSIYYNSAWRHAERHQFEEMYAALERAAACWAMVLSSDEYLAEWRKSRLNVLDGDNVALMFGRQLVEELVTATDSEIRRLTSLPAVQAYSRLRARNFGESMIREMMDRRVAGEIGGIPDRDGNRIACGRMGVEFFKLRVAACKRAMVLAAIHSDSTTSYHANLKDDASADERIRFQSVVAFRHAFFDLGAAHFDIRMGRAWEGLSKLTRLAGVEDLQHATAVDPPAGSLLYGGAAADEFADDLWRMVSQACLAALSNDLLKKRLDFGRLRDVVRRIQLATLHLPDRAAFWQEIAALFLARHDAILHGRRQPSLARLMACVQLLDLLAEESQEDEVRSRVNQAVGFACGNIAVMLANRRFVEESMKYMRRSLECSPEDLECVEIAVDLYERKIAKTASTAERVSHAKQLVEIMDGCAPHYEDADDKFDTLRRRAEHMYEIAKRQDARKRMTE